MLHSFYSIAPQAASKASNIYTTSLEGVSLYAASFFSLGGTLSGYI